MTDKEKRNVLTEIQQRVILAMEDEYMPVSKIIDLSGANSTAVLRAVDKLIKIGILEEKREETFPRRRLIRLTNKGRIIREKLREIYDLIDKGV
ncbi:winged helix DNA-binding protein [Sulfurisphaera ohwakuensis]|uniref:MarR family transcriptional regulator n=1 Tax=Sulfurisphaera ohwakuensis TaxID=69656 RepID=A0A650CGF1_SULOH|nr:winged helix DNA-binding protein [Sulfurisphaera ohwakuensis]MBB5255292.1 DNA-binding MarR family transcriptional regulator [Sulfurisphaera ohwakuensis]QGR16849.1 MarR family transcriptional regulator [Sulfurisphaera ohwakuensis]